MQTFGRQQRSRCWCAVSAQSSRGTASLRQLRHTKTVLRPAPTTCQKGSTVRSGVRGADDGAWTPPRQMMPARSDVAQPVTSITGRSRASDVRKALFSEAITLGQ